jgi:hypothetical protein
MKHKISEEWLLKLEQKLHLVSRKGERVSRRTEDILATVDELCQESDLKDMKAKSSKKRPSLWARFKLFLAHLFGK